MWGVETDAGYEVEFDLDALSRMDTAQRVEAATKSVSGGLMKPNEGRRRFNLPPVDGGDRVYMQKQNWPLALLGSDNTPAAAPTPPGDPTVPPTLPPPKAMIDYDELEMFVCAS